MSELDNQPDQLDQEIDSVLMAYDDPTNNGAGHHNVIFTRRQVKLLLLKARKDEAEYPAVLRAYNTGLGASEYESFLTGAEKKRIKFLEEEMKGVTS